MKYKLSNSEVETSVTVLISVKAEFNESELVTRLFKQISSALKEMQVQLASKPEQPTMVRLKLVEQSSEDSIPKNKTLVQKMYHLDFDI